MGNSKSTKRVSTRIPQLEVHTKSEAQAFRSEVNGALTPSKVAISGAMSGTLNHSGTECRVPKTALKPHASVPSLLQVHASLNVDHNVNCGIRV
jgi:hypothetical protein